ncbi:MAG: hypothetical protein HY784_17880 [Chloroflexi bacterium]|nr:hypothetical protein [Chloroflexota bacterium]
MVSRACTKHKEAGERRDFSPSLIARLELLRRGVQGIPQGNLNQYVFHPDDPNWEATVPASIPAAQRRTVVSCYSWPGIHAEACMRYYAGQLAPLMLPLLEKGYEGLSPEGGFFERAMYRATLKAWLESGHYEVRPR